MNPRRGQVTVLGDVQFGDGGKGKFVDAIAAKMHVVVRVGGGANAGYTVDVGDGTEPYKFHLIPAGILHPGVVNVVGPGVMYDLAVGDTEIPLAAKHDSILKLDRNAPVVLPLHRAIDFGREKAAGGSSIGTTKRGIGPCHEDLVSRRGLTLGDLVSRARVEQALARGGYWEEKMALAHHLDLGHLDLSSLDLGVDPLSFTETVDWCMRYAPAVCEHLADTRALVRAANAQGQSVLFQLVNGVGLDVFNGTRPYCTSAICTPAGVCATFGIYELDRVVGIAKAYMTRVGGGPFPTELDGEVGETLRKRGREYGTTTGRPRRCGWLDLEYLRYGCGIGGFRELVVTKLDVLSGFPDLHVCESYGLDDPYATLTAEVMDNVRPSLTPCESWEGDLSQASSISEFPPAAQHYLARITKATGLPILAVGVGPARSQLIWSNS